MRTKRGRPLLPLKSLATLIDAVETESLPTTPFLYMARPSTKLAAADGSRRRKIYYQDKQNPHAAINVLLDPLFLLMPLPGWPLHRRAATARLDHPAFTIQPLGIWPPS
jgi:hypothetical protein